MNITRFLEITYNSWRR